jgi:ankyrin repeat protein
VAKLLLEKGAAVDARNPRGDTPLLLAASGAHASVVSALLAARADKDAQNEFGDTALIIASRNGDAAIVRLLLSAGASTKLRNQDRVAAEDVAAARDFNQVLALLRQ